MPDYAKLLEAGIAAVAAACRVTRAVQSNMQALARIVKDDKSPVTVADYASQAVVARTLRELIPGDLFLVAEETSAFLRNPENAAHLAATVAAARESWAGATEHQVLAAIDDGAGDPHHPQFWTLDPIDGTKGFLRGSQYAVSLAYIERGTPVIGVLGCPNLPKDFAAPLDRPDRHGTLYFCIKGEGLYEIPADKPGTHPVKITRLEHRESDPITLCTSVEESHSNFDTTKTVMDELASHGLRQREPVRIDSQAKYAVVARGQADVYLRMPTRRAHIELIWDHAAGALVAAEGGVAVTDVDGRELDFSQGRHLSRNRGIVAAPTRVHGALMGAISRTISVS
jgi:HAL2 family 3'(2'),5'-bisphosphate nucleotidase